MPAVEVSSRLAARGVACVLVVGRSDLERRLASAAHAQVRYLDAPRLKGLHGLRLGMSVAKFPSVLAKAALLVWRAKAGVAIGFGGYTTGPVLLAARAMGVPVMVCEGNAVPGLTNRLAGKFASRVFVAFEQTSVWFSRDKVLVTGYPLRAELARTSRARGDRAVERILVLGGSQGSAFLNSRVPQVLLRVSSRIKGLEVLHQAGPGRSEEVKNAYAGIAGLSVTVVDFIDDMAEAYGWADFAITRAGAGTVAELACSGLPALLVPFARAADNHQVANGLAAVHAGGALMVEERDFDATKVANRLAELFLDTEAISSMSERMRSLCKADAADRVVDEVMRVLRGGEEQ